jgi:phosphatidylglycerol---prolipoprotein diacylglyceryl transferase
MIVASFPSPSHGVWHLGPLPVRAYALAILLGVVVAIWVGDRRWVSRGGAPGTVGDIAVWAVPFGLVGARVYHVVTDPELYFSAGKNPWAALYIWEGGLGIWGAIAAGCLGGYLACRRKGISFLAIADALAPGIVLAQAIGRWGNYFNQELYGKPSTLPWSVEIDPAHREPGMQRYATYQPTFLYESLWDLGVAGLVIWAERRFRLGFGRAFALYVMAYTVGRTWIEYLRVDTANHLLGVRLNVFTSVLVFLLALLFFVVSAKRHPGQPVIGSPPALGAEPDEGVALEPVSTGEEPPPSESATGGVRPDE